MNNKPMYKPDRPEGTLVKKFKLVCDVQAMPTGMSVEQFAKLADGGFIFYDSDKGRRPKLYTIDGDVEQETPVFIDTKGKEVDLETIQAKWEDEEFWRKELYKCKNSPIYYFNHYYSADYKPTQESLEKYLKDIGMEATNDSGDLGEEAVQKTKDLRESYANSITLELLKNLKPVRDSLKEDYDKETEKLKKEVVEKYELSGKLEEPIKEKIVNSILKVKPKEAPEKLKYYIDEKKGKWDKLLLRMTDIDILLRLWNLI